MTLPDDVRGILTSRDPLTNLFAAFEQAANGSKAGQTYVSEEWPEIKRTIVRQALKLQRSGSKIQGAIRRSPAQVATDLELVYSALLHNTYLTSQFWRAFHRHVKTGGFDPQYPLFGERDAELARSAVTADDLTIIRETDDRPDFLDDKRLAQIMKSIRPLIVREVWKRTRYLQRADPALYSRDDMVGELECRLIQKLRNEPRLRDCPAQIYGWAKKAVTNEIPNILEFATQEGRCRMKGITDAQGQPVRDRHGKPIYLVREIELTSGVEIDGSGEQTEIYPAVLASSEGKLTPEESAGWNRVLERAPRDIQQYLEILWAHGDDSEFWEWFRAQEPGLAARQPYLAEHPEAIGPWIMRWLGLSTQRVLAFLDDTMPNLGRRRNLA